MKAAGGDIAFKFEPRRVKSEAPRPDGAKAKDAYDLYFLIKQYPGGARQLALEFSGLSETPIVREMSAKLSEKFASVDHAGPVDIANFMDVSDDQEISMIRRDAFEQVRALLSSI
jgi:hypothetical protein